VSLGSDEVVTACVEFEESSISGMELLARAGLEIDAKYEGMGATVCRITNTGCPSRDCFCECGGGPDCTYWSYWNYREDNWQYARIGASANQVEHGDLDGWSWGPGSVTSAIEPPSIPYEQICKESKAVRNTVSESQTNDQNGLEIIFGGGAIIVLLGATTMIWRRSRN